MERLDPTLDLVFKLLLTRAPILIVDMLEAILARPIGGLELIDPEIRGDRVGDKTIIFDVRATLRDGTGVDIEMQRRATLPLPSRSAYYVARDHSRQLRRGDDYHQLASTIGIVWLAEPLRSVPERRHSIFELRDRYTHARYTDQLGIHLIQLAAPRPPLRTIHDARLDRWCRFFTARDDAAFERLASEDPIMAIATQTLDDISQDPEAQFLARCRADAAWFHAMERRSEQEQAREQGKAVMLLQLLSQRFGPLPQSVRDRIEAADSRQLERWGTRILTAPTLELVLGA